MALADLSPATTKRPVRTRARVVLGFLIIGLGLWILIQRHYNNLDYLIVTSESMEPTLHIGDRLLMERTTRFQVGDIVVFEEPGNATLLVVKRIMGLPGNMVVTQGDHVITTQTVPACPPPVPGKTWWIAPGEAFVAGDNRPVSRDSREYGPIPLDTIHGKIRYRILSRLRWERIK